MEQKYKHGKSWKYDSAQTLTFDFNYCFVTIVLLIVTTPDDNTYTLNSFRVLKPKTMDRSFKIFYEWSLVKANSS